MDLQTKEQIQNAQNHLKKAEKLHDKNGNVEEVRYELRNSMAKSLISIARSLSNIERELEQ